MATCDIPDFVPPKTLAPRAKKPERRTTYLSSSSGDSESGDDDDSDLEAGSAANGGEKH